MNIPSNYVIDCAVSSDAEQVNHIFQEENFEGGIAVSYLRNPDTLASFQREGHELVMMTLRDKRLDGRIVGLGGCVIRQGMVEGRRQRLGYLTGLKLLPQYRGRILLIPAIYQELYRLTKDKVDVYFTTILSENQAAWRMLEKKRRIMPEYRFLGEYHTYFCKTGRRLSDGRPDTQYLVKPCSGETAQRFYRGADGLGQRAWENFAVADALQNDLCSAEFYGLFSCNAAADREEPLAVGYVLDQRAYKQYVVHHYSGIYRLIARMPTGLLGYPGFPKAGQTAPCGAAGMWLQQYSQDSKTDGRLAHLLWRGMREQSVAYDFLLMGVHEGEPLMETFHREKKLDYRSRVYQVLFHTDKGAENGVVLSKGSGVHLDVALL